MRSRYTESDRTEIILPKERLTLTIYCVDRIKADEIIRYATKMGAGTDISLLPPDKHDIRRARFNA